MLRRGRPVRDQQRRGAVNSGNGVAEEGCQEPDERAGR